MSLHQPQALVDKLSRYKRSLEEVDLREKQLAAMRIDICNSENLKKLKGACFPPYSRSCCHLSLHLCVSLSFNRAFKAHVSLLQIRLEAKSFLRTLKKEAHNYKSSSSSLTIIVKQALRSCRSSTTPTSSTKRSTKRSKLLLM